MLFRRLVSEASHRRKSNPADRPRRLKYQGNPCLKKQLVDAILLTMKLRPFELERYFARHEFSAKYMLGSSDPESMSAAQLMALEPGVENEFGNIWLGYTESQGDPRLRHEISRHYQQIGPEQILMFSGAEEPIFTFMHAVLKPGDHIIVHFPSYQSHHSIAESRNISVTRWHADPEKGWAPDISQLPKLIRPETKAILICTPHNPTGYLFDAASWQQIIDLARCNDLWLFSDEVYRGSEHEPADRLPNMADCYEKGISLNCLSKNCGLAGLRIGWIATRDADLYNKMAAFKDYLTICNSAPSEFFAGIAVRNLEKLFEMQRIRLVRNLDILENFFARFPHLFRWKRPKAGTTTFPEFTGGEALQFCDRLVEEAGILLIPGTFFDMEGQFLRFGYGRSNFVEVIELFTNYLENSYK